MEHPLQLPLSPPFASLPTQLVMKLTYDERPPLLPFAPQAKPQPNGLAFTATEVPHPEMVSGGAPSARGAASVPASRRPPEPVSGRAAPPDPMAAPPVPI